MSTLVVYFSRTGNTRSVAEAVAERLRADHEPIVELGPARRGLRGWTRSVMDSVLHNLPAIRSPIHQPSAYDLVVIGTPVWSASMAAPVRTYLVTHQPEFREVAFFCTQGGSGAERAFAQMSGVSRLLPRATLAIGEGQLHTDLSLAEIDRFVGELRPVTLARTNGSSHIPSIPH
jgi:flavodoxin